MKTFHFKTDKAEIMLVELQENARLPTIFKDKDRPHVSYWVGMKTERYYFPQGYKYLKFIPDLTEEMCEPLVEKENSLGEMMYRWHRKNSKGNCFVDKALLSFLSLLETKVQFENPIKSWMRYSDAEINDEWENEQSRTFDKNRTLVLVKY